MINLGYPYTNRAHVNSLFIVLRNLYIIDNNLYLSTYSELWQRYYSSIEGGVS